MRANSLRTCAAVTLLAAAGVTALGTAGSASADQASYPQPSSGGVGIFISRTFSPDAAPTEDWRDSFSNLEYIDSASVGHTIEPDPGVSMTVGPDDGIYGPRTVSCTIDPASVDTVHFVRYQLSLQSSANVSTGGDEANNFYVVHIDDAAPLQGQTSESIDLDALAPPANGGRWMVAWYDCYNDNDDYTDYGYPPAQPPSDPPMLERSASGSVQATMTAGTASASAQPTAAMRSTLSFADDQLVRQTVTPDPYVSMTLGRERAGLGPRVVSCRVDPASGGMVTFSSYHLRLHGSVNPKADHTVLSSADAKTLQPKRTLRFDLDGLAAPAHGGRWVLDSATCGNHNSDPNYADHYRPKK